MALRAALALADVCTTNYLIIIFYEEGSLRILILMVSVSKPLRESGFSVIEFEMDKRVYAFAVGF
jgi:hypothetical protein